ncbi:MAG: AmmeMemoRadiSam system radical SAM enzyme [Clostridiales bacterium]|jgi:pyruvate formate lyase activating enzyme|nr:AmmeMemoRadiSam system radical SAM enzyme [Clostridiales bacterium]
MSGQITGSARCALCPHGCVLAPSQTGRCLARANQGGTVLPLSYGAYSAIALDPIEKKPLYHFCPGKKVLSIGGYGCNMHCAFCQNDAISQQPPPADAGMITPAQLASAAKNATPNIGVAFTYNEPCVGFEFVRDAAMAVRAAGLKTVLVTNGFLNSRPWQELVGLMDACNIDLKSFREQGYRDLGGALRPVKENIAYAVAHTHVEVTTLAVPNFADDESDMRAQAAWLASLNADTPLHITRYFPRYHFSAPATDMATLRRLAGVASQYLTYVYLGNC